MKNAKNNIKYSIGVSTHLEDILIILVHNVYCKEIHTVDFHVALLLIFVGFFKAIIDLLSFGLFFF